jgi:acetyl esterase/lipase
MQKDWHLYFYKPKDYLLFLKRVLKKNDMKVTKEMLHPDLQKYYFPLTLGASLISTKVGVKIHNFVFQFLKGKKLKGFKNEVVQIPSKNSGTLIRTRIFSPEHSPKNLPCVLYNHAGGYLFGNPEQFLFIYEKLLQARPCVLIAPDYRLSVEAPYPAAFDDCYDTLLWAKENAEKLGIDPEQFIVVGHSAGGGLTAAITNKARDTQDVKIAFQMPIYPMLDDRQTDSSRDITVPVWNTKSNTFAWNIYLKNIYEKKRVVPVYAAPARNDDFTGFPPTITFVGEYEPFREETLSYVENLRAAGIPVKFKFYEKAFHAFDMVAPNSSIGKDAFDFTTSSFCEFYDKYCK